MELQVRVEVKTAFVDRRFSLTKLDNNVLSLRISRGCELPNSQLGMWPFTPKPTTDDLPYVARTDGLQNISSPSIQEAQSEPDLSVFQLLTGYRNERLGMPFVIRAPLLLTTSFVSGFLLGGARGGPRAADRYRAENAHRLPATQSGWYLYHKSKNYHTIVGGVTEGVKFGGVLSAWASLYMITEEVVDRARERVFASGDGEHEIATGQRDVVSTVVAAMSTAGLYSWKRGLDRFTAARTARIALKYSLLYGFMQDLAASLRGNRPIYVDRIVGLFGGRTQKARGNVRA